MCTQASGPVPTFVEVPAVDNPIGGAVEVIGNPEAPDVLYVPQHFVGDVRIVQGGKLLPMPLLHVNVRQAPPGKEQGLLSIVLSPDFTTNHLMYVHYSAAADPTKMITIGQTTIDEFKLTSATQATFVRNIYSHVHSHQFHNGGTLQFGPDKMLYMSIGDNNADCGPPCANMPDGFYGRILKMDVSAAAANTMPPTFMFGLRNPWRWSFDPLTYDVVIGDVGNTGAVSEKLFFSRSGANQQGTNWQWIQGDGRMPPGTIDQLASNMGAIIGGRVYRGTNPKMAGACGLIFYGHLNGQVWTIKNDGTGKTMQAALSGIGNVSSFGVDANGELYITHLSGEVFRIDAK
jgi:hypothetical protein